jgi:UDP-N-acetylglucosamine acyltransferase
MRNIHPTAIIGAGAVIPASAEIGAYCVVGGNVKLGEGVVLKSHIVLDGITTIGEGTKIYPFASVGTEPQDKKYHGERSELVIGKNNVIREHVTINPGTEGGGNITRIGDNCLLMVGVHIAHDCIVGNDVILANNATLAGHVSVGDFAIIGGLSAVHQFVRIGHHAMIGGMSGIEADVIPYGSAHGERAHLTGLNLVGLKRRQFSRDDIHSLRIAFRQIFSNEGTLEERLNDAAEQFKQSSVVGDIIGFIRSDSSRALCQPNYDRAA